MKRGKAQDLENYIAFKMLSVKSSAKIEDTERYVRRFLDYCKKDLEDITELDLTNFLNSLKMGTYTLNSIKVYLKNFIKWKFPEDYIKRFRNLDKICKQEKPEAYDTKKILKKNQVVEDVIKAEPSIFWKAYYCIIYYGGCRPIEVRSLKFADFEEDKDGGAFFDIMSKKNKRAFVKYLPQEAYFYLKELKRRAKSDYVFPSPSDPNKPINEKACSQRLRKLHRDKVMSIKVTPYQLRHSISTLRYGDESLKDDDVANSLGHSKSMKKVYGNFDREKLKEMVKKIVIGTENLPPEQKAKYDKEISELRDKIKSLEDAINFFRDNIPKQEWKQVYP